jgi:hypothetical protein
LVDRSIEHRDYTNESNVLRFSQKNMDFVALRTEHPFSINILSESVDALSRMAQAPDERTVSQKKVTEAAAAAPETTTVYSDETWSAHCETLENGEHRPNPKRGLPQSCPASSRNADRCEAQKAQNVRNGKRDNH